MYVGALTSQKKGVGSLGARVAGSCELPGWRLGARPAKSAVNHLCIARKFTFESGSVSAGRQLDLLHFFFWMSLKPFLLPGSLKSPLTPLVLLVEPSHDDLLCSSVCKTL